MTVYREGVQGHAAVYKMYNIKKQSGVSGMYNELIVRFFSG